MASHPAGNSQPTGIGANESDSQQLVRQYHSQNFAQCPPLQGSTCETKKGVDFESARVLAAGRFLHVAGGVFAPEPMQRRMAAKLFKGAALDFADGPDGNPQQRGNFLLV